MYYVKSKVQSLVKDKGKRMSKEAWEALDGKIVQIIASASKFCGHHKTIRDTEIYMAKGGGNGQT